MGKFACGSDCPPLDGQIRGSVYKQGFVSEGQQTQSRLSLAENRCFSF